MIPNLCRSANDRFRSDSQFERGFDPVLVFFLVFEFERVRGTEVLIQFDKRIVVGEKIARAIERAIQNKSSLIIVSCSGGARMQEGILSLMQMGKTSASLAQLSEHGLPYISILTDPTTGGVSASFAMLGDVIIAEPGALVGFAGPRVIQQTINQKLPEGFQTSEFLQEHGLIDQVVHRKDLRSIVENFLSHMNNSPIKAHDKEPDSLPSIS